MPTTLSKKAVEKSTFIVTAQFWDENGDPVPPDSLQWSLVDEDNNVVNGRDRITVSSPSDTVDVVLQGEDLVVDPDRKETPRWVVFEGTYTSETYGSDLPITDQAEFRVLNLKKVT